MVIRHHYHEVLSFGESLMIFIIRSLQERDPYKRLTRVVEQVFPGAGNFKLPPGDTAVRITFAEGVKLLREAGIEAEEYDDLRYSHIIFTNLHRLCIYLFPNQYSPRESPRAPRPREILHRLLHHGQIPSRYPTFLYRPRSKRPAPIQLIRLFHARSGNHVRCPTYPLLSGTLR